MQEYIAFELKFYKTVSLYRSPSRSQDDFETSLDNLELTLDKNFETNPFLVIALGVFSGKLSQ